MTFQEFKTYWEEVLCKENPDNLREGQILMNYLFDVWPKEYSRIVYERMLGESTLDCFYNDKYIHATLTHLEKNWERFPN